MATLIGNVMEWYDFSIFGFMAIYLGPLFFPASDPTTSLIQTYGVFAAGFFMRPIGAMLIGDLGDRLGRRPALVLSVVMMAVPTVLIGLLPTYATAGIWAPILLAVMRMVQGLSLGGEYTASISYGFEHAAPGRRGLAASFALLGGAAGILLAAATAATLASLLDTATISDWGWRLPFIAGSGIAVLGLFVRSSMPETPQFEAMKADDDVSKSPLAEAFGQHLGRMVAMCLFAAVGALAFYVVLLLVPNFLQRYVQLAPAQAAWINTLGIFTFMVTMPFMAAASDRFGRKPVMLTGIGGMVVLAVPMFMVLSSGVLWATFLAQIILAMLSATISAPVPAALAELFPARARLSGMSISYNMSQAIFGGSAPLIATWGIQATGLQIFPALLLIAAALISTPVILMLPEPSGQGLTPQPARQI
jgi:MHS family proline/betaine transporter-like MFS transporter